MSKSTNRTINGTLVYKQFIQLDDGTEVQVRYNQDASLYAGTDVTLYEYDATTKNDSGEKITVKKYAVAVEDAKRAKRTSTKEAVSNMIAQGLTADEIVAKLAGL